MKVDIIQDTARKVICDLYCRVKERMNTSSPLQPSVSSGLRCVYRLFLSLLSQCVVADGGRMLCNVGRKGERAY